MGPRDMALPCQRCHERLQLMGFFNFVVDMLSDLARPPITAIIEDGMAANDTNGPTIAIIKLRQGRPCGVKIDQRRRGRVSDG